jgi:hypothetical protein
LEWSLFFQKHFTPERAGRVVSLFENSSSKESNRWS